MPGQYLVYEKISNFKNFNFDNKFIKKIICLQKNVKKFLDIIFSNLNQMRNFAHS